MKKEVKKNKSNLILISIIFTILFVLIALSLIYIFKYKEDHKKDIFYDYGSITMKYSNNSNIYFNNNLLPLSDKDGKNIHNAKLYYDFTVDVNLADTKSSVYEILVKFDKKLTNITPDKVKIYLEKQDSGSYLPVVEPILFSELKNKSKYSEDSDSFVLTTVINEKSDYHNYRLRMWLDENYTVPSENLISCGIEINISGKTKSE